MTTLADINDTLIKNRQVLGAKQTFTSARVDALTAGFKKFTDLLESESSADDLDALNDRDQTGKTSIGITPQNQDGDSKGGKGRFFDFDLGNFLPLLGGLLGGFLKRGTLAIVAALLADEVAKGVKNLTGSDILANVAEWATMGGAIGFLFGAKFGLIGVMLGALFSDASREKIAGILSDIFKKEIEATDKETYAAAGLAALAAGLIAKLIPVVLPKLMGFFLSPVGLAVVALGALTGLTYKYFTDAEFKKAVDDKIQPLRNKMLSFIEEMIEAIKDILDNIFDPLATTLKEKQASNQILGADVVAARTKAENQKDTSQLASAAVSSAKLGIGAFNNDKPMRENVLTALDQVGLSGDPEVAKIVAANTDGEKLANALIKHFGGKIDEAKTTLAPIQKLEVQADAMREVREDLREADTGQLKFRRDGLQKQLDVINSRKLLRRNAEESGNLAKLQSQLAFAEQELARRSASANTANGAGNSVNVDARDQSQTSPHTTVMPPSRPSATDPNDPVREAVVF